MPILKYMLLTGSSLLALIFVAEQLLTPAPAAMSRTSTSLELLRKTANHGELRPFATAAAAGPFLPMPEVVTQPQMPVNEVADRPGPAAAPAILDAQARLPETDTIEKPMRPRKKVASRKPKPPRSVYVENVQHGPSSFFGGFQSW